MCSGLDPFVMRSFRLRFHYDKEQFVYFMCPAALVLLAERRLGFLFGYYRHLLGYRPEGGTVPIYMVI